MRIIDANTNRAVEGIRVIEDVFRFIYNNQEYSSELRNIRHQIRSIYKKEQLIKHRDVKNDIGIKTSFESTIDKKSSYKNVILANFSRVAESLRVLEEVNKAGNKYQVGKEIERIRFKIYAIESEFFKTKRLNFGKEIYGITNEKLSGISPVKQVQLFVQKDIRIIQYREKNKSKKERLKDCIAIKNYLDTVEDHLFIVNDDIEIADIVKADGIHLGQDDVGIKYVKEKYPNLIIGVSTHNETQVREAIKENADYIGVGPIFPTTTKKNLEPSKGLEFLEWVEKRTEIPIVAIGGINKTNINKVFKKGGKTVAMISQLSKEKQIDEILEVF